MKKRVILGQLGWAYSDEFYLPLSAGMLAAHCNADKTFREHYEIDPWLRFAREDPKKIVDSFEVPPDVLGLSMYVWCERISLEVARLTKERWPNCLVVLGGPSVSDHHYGERLLREHPYVDVLVHGEGEETFRELLLAEIGAPGKLAVAGLSYLDAAQEYYKATLSRERERDLDRFPSPFLDGTFDRLLAHPAAKDVRFAGVWEPDRGCPFAAVGGAVVALPNRLLRFEELEYSAPYPVSTGACRVHGHAHKGCSTDDRLLFQGTRRAMRFRFSNGLSLLADPAHPINTVVGETREMRQAGELTVGDYVAIERGQNNVTEEVVLDSHDGLPARLSANLAWIVGFLVGDGSLGVYGKRGKNYNVQFAVDDRTQPLLLERLEWVFGVVPRVEALRNTTKCRSVVISSKRLYTFFTDTLDVRPSASGEKLRLPEPVCRSPKAVVRAFLKGLWEADGYSPRGDIRPSYLVTTSERLAEDVAAAIHWIGDVAVVRRLTGRGFKKGVQFRAEWHGSECDRQNGRGRMCARQMIPAKLYFEPLVDSTLVRRKHPRPNTHRGVSRAQLTAAEPHHPLLGDEWAYTRIASIDDAGEVPLYDAHNHPSHRFSVNGVSVHNCTYCAWGTATASKIHTFSIPRLLMELEWMAVHEIEFCYGASANFGQLPRDVEIAQYLADVRNRTGYPKKFCTNTAKNATERIFTISKILHDAGLAKGATLSPQTWDKGTLVNIKRSNIKPKTYTDLQRMFTDAGIPTYAEIIVGLPGETLDSFCAGIDAEIEMGQHDGLAIYPCRVLPGTEMAEPEYRKVHGIVTKMTPILANHSDIGASSVGPTEYEETVIGTSSMSTSEWKAAMKVSWFVQCFHQMKAAYFPLELLRTKHNVKVTEFARWFLALRPFPGSSLLWEMVRVQNYVDDMANGGGDGVFTEDLEKAGLPKIRWPIEEATWLALSIDREAYFTELWKLFDQFCEQRNIQPGYEIDIAIDRLRKELRHWSTEEDPELKDPAVFAKRVVWWGRRGGSFLKGDV